MDRFIKRREEIEMRREEICKRRKDIDNSWYLTNLGRQIDIMKNNLDKMENTFCKIDLMTIKVEDMETTHTTCFVDVQNEMGQIRNVIGKNNYNKK